MNEKVAGKLAQYRKEFETLKAQVESLGKKRAELDREIANGQVNLNRLDAAIFALTEIAEDKEAIDAEIVEMPKK